MMISEESMEPICTIPESSSDWDIGVFFQILRHRVWVLALWIAIMLTLGVVFLLVVPAHYVATTVVEVEQEERPVVTTQDVAPVMLATPEIVKTFEQKLDNGALLLRVFKVNKLDQDPRYLAEQA